MKITEQLFLLMSFGIVLLLLPMLGESSIVGATIRQSWNKSIVFLLGAVSLFYFGVLLNKIKMGNLKLMNRCIVLTLFFSVAVFFASRSFEFEEVLRIVLVMLLIPFIDCLIKKCGARLVGYFFVAIILIQSQWGLAQFIVQRDLGFYLLGESRLSNEVSGVAKFGFYNCAGGCEEGGKEKLIRSYGAFQHANVFGGVMVIGLMTIALLSAGFNVQTTLWSRVASLSSIFFLSLGLLVSFSRSAFIAASILLFVFSAIKLYLVQGVRVRRLFIVYRDVFVVLIILVALFSPLLIARFIDSEDVAIEERIGGANWAISLVRNNSWWQGVGPGAYKGALKEYLDQHNGIYQYWQIDNVHSVSLLIATEWGLMLSSIFLFILLVVMIKKYSGTWYWFTPIIPIVLFDHYMLTQTAPMVYLIVWVLLVYHLRQIDMGRDATSREL